MGIALKSVVVCLVVAAMGPADAQGLRTVFSFSGTNGANAVATLLLGNDGNFYGTTSEGGYTNGSFTGGMGTVFKLTTNGTLTTLVSFALTNGASPQAALTIAPDGNFYSTTWGGGNTNVVPGGWGTVFRVTPDGALTSLATFAYTNGRAPASTLTVGAGGYLFGTTAAGGSSDVGTVFRITTNGTLTSLVSFQGQHAEPLAALTPGSDGNFYGSTYLGGIIDSAYPNGNGTIFRVTPNGALTTLAVFSFTNGASPQSDLTLGNDGSFYGSTFAGGPTGSGTLFRVTPTGTLNTLVSFGVTNGQNPQAPLTLGDDGNFYGTTLRGGSGGAGTVFKMTTNGTLTTLVSFGVTNGGYPVGGLMLGNDGNLYGTTTGGGSGSFGTVFSLPGPPITIQPQGPTTLATGSDVTYRVSVVGLGAPPFDFQWFLNGSPLAGATTSSLAITNVDAARAGRYSVTVSNSSGSASAFRILRLRNSPVVLVDGVDVGGGPVGRIAGAQISMFSGFGTSAQIYYTLDGTGPNYLSTPYQGAFQVNTTTTIRAIAYDSGYLSSAEAAPITVEMVPIYSLTATTPGGGSLSFSPAPYNAPNLYVSNTPVTVTATASNGWSLMGWLGDALGSGPAAQLTMNLPMTVEAIFGTTVVSNVLGAGEIQFSSSGPVYPFGAAVGVTAVPQAGNYFINWAGALSGASNPNSFVVNGPGPVATALFGPLSVGQYTLTVLPAGEGTVTIAPYTNRYASGSPVTVTATPKAGQAFIGWSGDATGSQNPLPLTMTQSKVIKANFTTRYSLSVAPPLNRLSEEGFRFSVLGELGTTYRIDGSADLSTWAPIGFVTNELGTAQFLDPAALTNAFQFYRAVTQ